MPEQTSQKLMLVESALQQVLLAARSRMGADVVAIDQADGRVLQEDVIALCDVPPWDNSAMDGYALDAESVKVGQPLEISQRIPAGVAPQPLKPGTAARIFTGAPLPAGASAVAMQENCVTSGGAADASAVTIRQVIYAGENVRRRGADIRRGSRLFSAGHRLRPQDIGLLASVGIAEISVGRQPVVALMTTGSELVRPGTALGAGQIYDSNFYVLSALLRRLGLTVIESGVVSDSLERTENALERAAAQADVIISSGGVSAGEEDHVRDALMRTGHLAMWKLALKPGKPFVFGEIDDALFFGLPGNPVSSFVTFVLLVRPALLAMMGASVCSIEGRLIPAGFSASRSGSRQEYLRVCVEKDGAHLIPLADQSSGVLSSVAAADGLAVIPPFTAVSLGMPLRFLPFDSLA
jgi:molybdopterin molybdotransferase